MILQLVILYKNIINKILSIFYTKPKSENEDIVVENNITNTNSEENYFDIVISLKKDFSIDLIVYINDQPDPPLSIFEYALMCSEFMDNSFSTNTQSDIINIINQHIKNTNNKIFIDSLNIIHTKKNYNKKISDNTFIKPTEAFSINSIQ